MKIRSTIELNTALNNALAWRKKEITTLLLNIRSQRRAHIKKAYLRASIPMIYAHWEGFIKEASSCYLEFVSRQRLQYCELTTNFIAVSCKSIISDLSKSKRINTHNQFIDFIMLNQSDRARVPYNGVVDTESNLSSRVLQNLLNTIGLPYDEFWKSKSLGIDGKLLHYRNKIAHGEKHEIDETTFLELHDLVINSLDYIKNSIENHATQKKYKRNPTNHSTGLAEDRR